MALSESLLVFQVRREYVAGEVQVVPDPLRCMQCGLCSYNCPMGIDVRSYAWKGQPVDDSRCLACGMCIANCPRVGLRFERLRQATQSRP